MDTAKLKKFAQAARRQLIDQVSSKLNLVLGPESPARRERTEAVKSLENQIKTHGQATVVDRVAYIWFNRFCALRFMDVNRYTRIGVVSPAEGQLQPEILAEAKMGHIDEDSVPEKTRHLIFALLDDKSPSRDPQGEAYRLLVVAACNFWNQSMPFLFERIADYTELLMPDDLLSENSILAQTREAMTPDACEDVEVIGWLYQFYISEKKDEVFDGLKKNKKITPENIPAATQLFTPHWIVRYLVENSLGRLWLLNRPGSKLVEQMEYYIKPEQPETDFLKISRPEDIKICDPACGSGHMLTYAFDLLYAIYEEEGYEPAEIPEKILTHNLYGIEIDERAGELAAVALTMKARAKHRRFFSKGVKPNVCVLQNLHFDQQEIDEYMDFVGRDLFTLPLQRTLKQFEEADNFGSLIRPDLTDVDAVLGMLESKSVSGHLFLSQTHQKVLQALRQADYLSPKYHVVIANPPYMGIKGMNGELSSWLKSNYPTSKSDAFSCFIERGLELIKNRAYCAMVTMESWMFLSSFEKLRMKVLGSVSIQSMVHMPYLGKGGTSMGISFGTTAFILNRQMDPSYKGLYCCIRYYETDDAGVPHQFPPKNERLSLASSSDFLKIPGSPIAYWIGDKARKAYESGENIGSMCYGQPGLQTSDNNQFIRLWHEVTFEKIGFGFQSSEVAAQSKYKWFPYLKGGDYRRWYGNHEYLVNWFNNGIDIKQFVSKKYPYLKGNIDYVVKDRGYYFKELVSYTKMTSAKFNARTSQKGFLFDVAGSSIFPDYTDRMPLLGFLNSKTCDVFLRAQNPTMNIQSGDINNLPFSKSLIGDKYLALNSIIDSCINLSKPDWDSYETSWDFMNLPLLNPAYYQPTLKATYQNLRTHWREMMLEMQRLEEENNRIFIEAYGLQDELTPEVPLNEITLTCNPHYRYGGDKNEDELEALLLADTLRELVSYAVGCSFGRYSLDKPGLILANQGETLADYLAQVPQPTFPADDDNVIPLLDGDWFTDDIAERFRQFLRVAFGEAHYEDNLRFVEQGLNIKDKRNYSIRDYFLNEFYTEHVKRYKKRPIYWLFSSPKGSFNALIYMHRYRPDTVSVVLNDYLREFRTKLTAHKSHLEAVSISGSASQGEKTKALKEIESLRKIIDELDGYERDILYPLATEQLEIDLDDGVKANYPKFGAALKKIVGLDASDE